MKNEHATRLEYERIKMVDRMDQRDAKLIAARAEIARLRNALQATIGGIAWDWQGHVVGNLPDVREAAIKALEVKQ